MSLGRQSSLVSVFERVPLALLALTLLVAGTARAQEVTAAVTGVVTDPSGAAIVRAKVTAKDLDRGVEYPAVSDDSGSYNLPRIPVGNYQVRAEAAGFRTAVDNQVVLQLNQNAKLDFSLQIGDATQVVEVTSAAPILQTQSTQLGTVLDAKTNAQLPLATRNYVQLTLLAPGAVTTDPSTFTGAQSTFTGGRPIVNGNREQSDNFLLDGMDNNQISENAVGYTPSVDAIEEFNMITQNASAEFGNFMGGIISVSTKAGTNQFHGDAFEFFRNDKLNANNWANNWAGLPRPLLRWNEFGAAAGGRIFRDKLFFFADYQGSRYDQPATSSTFTVLTAAERAGDFSQLLTQQGIQLVTPTKRTNIPNNNLASAGLISPQASAIVNSSLYPQPINGNLINNAVNTTHQYTNQDQGDIRVDWNASDKDHLFGRYSQAHITNPTTNSIPLLYNSENVYPTFNGVLNYTRSFGAALVNEFRFGVNYIPVVTGALSGTAFSAGSVGIPGVPTTVLPGFVFNNGNLGSDQGNGTAFGNPEVLQEFADTVIQAEDTVVVTRGSHSMRAGFQVFRDRINTFYSGNAGVAGQFGFNGQYTGAAESDFLAGYPFNVQGGISGGTWGQRSTVYGTFFQDDWRITPKLTLNLGLRWELHTPWVEVKNRQSNFNEVTGQLEIAGQNGNSQALYNQYNGITNFQPRVGIAYSPNSSTVIRAAYTLSNYLEGTGTNLRLTLNPPFATEHNVNYSVGQTPSTLAQGYTIFEGGSSTGAINYQGASLRIWDPNFRPAVSNQWNFTLQHQFGNSLTTQVSYVGQSSDHLVVPVWASQLQRLSDGTVQPGYLSQNPTLLNELGNAKLSITNGIQNYNALQVSVVKRLGSGLEFQANYTWSKCMSDAVGYYGGYGQAVGNWYYWQDTYNSRLNYGPCYYDVEHGLNGFVTYDIPFGRGRAFGKNLNKVVDAVAGGWQINAIVNWRGGFPMTIDSNSDNSGVNNPNQLASCIGKAHTFGTRSIGTGGYQWFDPTAYANESANSFGTCGVGTIRGPGLHTADLSLTKNFTITEHQHLELRAEGINFTNSVILNAPNTSIGTTLGQITTSQGERNIQFALKYVF